MGKINFFKYGSGIGLILLILFGCSPEATITPMPPVPSTSIANDTAIVTTVPTTQVEFAQAFAGPILAVIAEYPPNFEDDFTIDTGWIYFASPCSFDIEDGLLRVQLGTESCAFTNEALTRKDFVFQFDSRMTAGDAMSMIQVNYHHITSGGGIYQLTMNSLTQDWLVTIFKEVANAQIAQGTGLVSPMGEYTQVQIIARGSRSAIYINGTPAAYFEDPEFNTSGRTWFSCASYAETICEFDNIKLWELASIPGLP
jgi:hypothetical protein